VSTNVLILAMGLASERLEQLIEEEGSTVIPCPSPEGLLKRQHAFERLQELVFKTGFRPSELLKALAKLKAEFENVPEGRYWRLNFMPAVSAVFKEFLEPEPEPSITAVDVDYGEPLLGEPFKLALAEIERLERNLGLANDQMHDMRQRNLDQREALYAMRSGIETVEKLLESAQRRGCGDPDVACALAEIQGLVRNT